MAWLSAVILLMLALVFQATGDRMSAALLLGFSGASALLALCLEERR